MLNGGGAMADERYMAVAIHHHNILAWLPAGQLIHPLAALLSGCLDVWWLNPRARHFGPASQPAVHQDQE